MPLVAATVVIVIVLVALGYLPPAALEAIAAALAADQLVRRSS